MDEDWKAAKENWLAHEYTIAQAKACKKRLGDERLKGLLSACEKTHDPDVREMFIKYKMEEMLVKFFEGKTS